MLEGAVNNLLDCDHGGDDGDDGDDGVVVNDDDIGGNGGELLILINGENYHIEKRKLYKRYTNEMLNRKYNPPL